MDRLGRADVQAVCWVDGHHKSTAGADLPRQDRLLQIAAGEQLDLRGRAGRGDVEERDQALGEVADGLADQEGTTRQRCVPIPFQGQVIADCQVWHQSDPQPIPRHVADADSDDAVRRLIRHVLPAHLHVAGHRRAQPRDDLRQLPLPVAGHAGDAQNLALADLEGDTLQSRQAFVIQRLQSLNAQHHVPNRAAFLLDLKQHLPPHHQARQLLRAGLSRDQRVHILAGAQHSHAVGELHHLVKLVGDEDNRLALLGHPAQGTTQVVGFLGCQDGRRLIQDQDVSATVQEP